MSESDERRDDERDEAAPADDTPDWNTPEIGGGDDGDLPIAVRRVLASDRHLSQRRIFYRQSEAGEGTAEPAENEAENKGETPR